MFAFLYTCMVVEVSNPANKHMHYGDKAVVGVIDCPENLPNKIIYSGIEANKQYNQMERDIYEGIKKAPTMETYKFPLVLKLLLGIGTIATGIIFRKDIWKFLKKFIKNPFKSTH